jgi:hypothetical protein
MTPTELMALVGMGGPSWDGWRGILARLTPAVRELYVIAGRGSGKSRIVALLAVAYAIREYPRAPGESIYIGVFAPDRRQAGITFRYIVGLLRSVPELAALVVAERTESIELRTGVVVEVITASGAAPRGRAYALAIVEEAAFLPTEETAADPDVELLRAVRPALARVPGSLLAVIGSPYVRRGVLYEAWRQGDGGDRVVVSADTLSLNPTFRRREVERAFEVDPVAARSEYGVDGVIEFRADVSGLLGDESIAAVTPAGVRELAPERGRSYVAHLDAATGSGEDAAALAIACHDGERGVLCAVRQWKPPFSPAAMARDSAALLRTYHVSDVTIDRFAPGLVADLLRREGISARPAGHDTSAAFVELLAGVNADRVRLLDDPVLLRELSRLERRPGVSGRDHVGHPPRGHDDIAAAAAFALGAVLRETARGGWGLLFAGGPDEGEDDICAALAAEAVALFGGGS